MTVAIGFFDGVHLGHQAILRGADVALTFKNHPLSFLAPARAPRLIMSWERRARTIRQLGVHVTALDFDADIAGLSPEAFLGRLVDYAAGWSDLLKKSAQPLQIRAGANWHFGKGGVGDADFARAHGLATTVVPYALYQGEPISSTRIRAALAAGELEAATAMLGRPFEVSGTVFQGKGKGRGLGYPTVNVRPEGDFARHLPLGVYAVRWHGLAAVANFGQAPTFGADAWPTPVWEVHLLESPRDLPACGAQTEIDVVRFVRAERRFDSTDALCRQIASDCDAVRRVLGND